MSYDSETNLVPTNCSKDVHAKKKSVRSDKSESLNRDVQAIFNSRSDNPTPSNELVDSEDSHQSQASVQIEEMQSEEGSLPEGFKARGSRFLSFANSFADRSFFRRCRLEFSSRTRLISSNITKLRSNKKLMKLGHRLLLVTLSFSLVVLYLYVFTSGSAKVKAPTEDPADKNLTYSFISTLMQSMFSDYRLILTNDVNFLTENSNATRNLKEQTGGMLSNIRTLGENLNKLNTQEEKVISLTDALHNASERIKQLEDSAKHYHEALSNRSTKLELELAALKNESSLLVVINRLSNVETQVGELFKVLLNLSIKVDKSFRSIENFTVWINISERLQKVEGAMENLINLSRSQESGINIGLESLKTLPLWSELKEQMDLLEIRIGNVHDSLQNRSDALENKLWSFQNYTLWRNLSMRLTEIDSNVQRLGYGLQNQSEELISKVNSIKNSSELLTIRRTVAALAEKIDTVERGLKNDSFKIRSDLDSIKELATGSQVQASLLSVEHKLELVAQHLVNQSALLDQSVQSLSNLTNLDELLSKLSKIDKKVERLEQALRNQGSSIAALTNATNTVVLIEQCKLLYARCEDCGNQIAVRGRTCYYFSALNALSWTTAASYCAQRNGYLVAIESEEENLFVYTKAAALLMTHAWIGLSFKPTLDGIVCNRSAPLSDHWFWQGTNRTAAAYTKWNTGEPSHCSASQSAENCAQYFRSPSWNDGRCSLSFPYICEFP